MRIFAFLSLVLCACDDEAASDGDKGDGGDDTGEDCTDTTTWYGDVDGDGYGNPAVNRLACLQPSGFVTDGNDCDDDRADVHPGATETDCTDPTDYNCDGSAGAADADSDGVAACEGDCDDANGDINPTAAEVCNDTDDDCDGTTDEDASDAATWFTDTDGDGYGAAEGPSVVACDQSGGFAASNDDCDDSDGAFHPAATEADCTDPNDYNCDGSVGYADADGDLSPACLDCNDADSAVNASAVEICDGVDNDCDGNADADAVDLATFYADSDGDGFGDPASATAACSAGGGLVADATDCDDAANATFPGAGEFCDGVDNDCEGTIDNGALDAGSWYLDADSDGYGHPAADTLACDAPAGSVADGTDCDDASSEINPGAVESCDGVDDDCDGTVDDGVLAIWYDDADGDGYGDPSTAAAACSPVGGQVADGADCDDGDPDRNPGIAERCDGIDNDCEGGTTDEVGLAAYQDGAGTWLDVTATLAAGTATSPVSIGDGSGYALPASDGTVYLCAGIWNAKIVLGTSSSDLSVVGIDGAGSTILTTEGTSGGASGSVVAVGNATLAIEGVTITGGIGSSGTKGGGVAVSQTTGASLPARPNLTLTDCVVTGNETDYGGGIAILGYGWIDLIDTVVEENSAAFAGGGAWLQSTGKLSCKATALGLAGIVANSSPTGGGMYLSSSGNGTIETTGCDWGDDAAGDDNATYDVQQQPSTSHHYCYTNATSLADVVECSGGTCTASTDSTCP